MKRTGPNLRTAGYSLIEMVLVLTLLAVFAGVANKLFMSSLIVKRDARHAGDDLVRTDCLIRLIRSDMWGASAIHSESPDRVTIEWPDGSAVLWELSATAFEDKAETLIIRTELIEGEEMPGNPLFAPPDLAFRADGTELYLTAGSSTVRLTSMFNLLGEAGP